MKSKGPEVRLKNGVKLPLMGLGKLLTFNIFYIFENIFFIVGTTHNGGYVHETVVYALKGVVLFQFLKSGFIKKCQK